MVWRVLVSDAVSEEGLAVLKERDDVQVDVKLKQTEDQLVEVIGDYHALLVRSETKVTRRIIERGDQLKIIGRAGVGVDNIDVPAATEKGIVVVNSPDGNTIAATEHTLAMMLALARYVPQANALLHQGVWEKKKFMGVEVRGKTLAVVGLGKIGGEVARRARAFEMNIMAYDPYASAERAAQVGAELVDLEKAITEADFITVHLPINKETYHLLGAERIARMKPGVRILNVARGGIVDEEALYNALKSGHVAGAAIDVFEHEPVTDSPLFELDSIVVTPHLGASTAEAQVSVAVDVAGEVLRTFTGEQVQNAVNIPSFKADLKQVLDPYLELVEKLGRFAAQLAGGAMERIEIEYNGEISRYDLTPLTNTALKGLLRSALGDSINYVNAPVAARNRGIKVSETRSTEMRDFTNLVTIRVETGRGSHSVAGTLLQKNQPRIVRLDRFSVDAVPEGNLLVIPHTDKPRIIGPVGNAIGAYDINIATMQVGREVQGGPAVMLLTVDSSVPEPALEDIRRIDGVIDVKYVSF